MQIVTSWMEQGIEQGIEQGATQEAQTIVLKLLNRRLGSLSAAQTSQLLNLSVTQLEALSEALLDFSTPADLEQWLQASLSLGNDHRLMIRLTVATALTLLDICLSKIKSLKQEWHPFRFR